MRRPMSLFGSGIASNPTAIILEIVYTLLIIIFCFLVYYKTREVYQLSKHKGVGFFRLSFLFFGLSYTTRILLFGFLMGAMAINKYIPRRDILSFSLLILSYFSTMAILCLIYSTTEKKINSTNFLIISNIIAVIASTAGTLLRSHEIIIFLQLILLVSATILIIFSKKHISKMRLIYLLLFLFWIINLYVLGPRWRIPLELKWLTQAISIAVFLIIIYKVQKWLR